MINDVYDTIACNGYRMEKIINELQKELITNYSIADLVIDEQIVRGIKVLIGENDNIAPFTHPVLVYNNDKPCVVIDIRRLVRRKSSDITNYEISNKIDYDLLVLRARLQAVAIFDSAEQLKNFDYLPTTIFARWVNNSISFKLGLAPHDQNITTIIAMGYYLNLFDDGNNLSDIALMVAKNTYIDPHMVTDTLEINDFKLDTLTGLVDQLKNKISNIRIEKLNLPLFLSSLTYGWRGNSAKEVMAIALEHPPTWIACLATAMKDKGFKDSPIAKISKFYTRNNKDKEFLMRLDNMLAISEKEV